MVAGLVLGRVPPSLALPILPAFSAGSSASGAPITTSAVISVASAMGSASSAASGSIMSLILPQVEHGARQPKVWVGDGLPPIPKKLHERILKWEFIELSELLPSGALERVQPELEPQKFIIMPGLEVARPRKKPIESITQWIRCFAIYVAVLATEFPDAVPDLLAYMLAIMRAQAEYEEPAWRLYDEAFRDKAASTGNRKWALLDTHLYNQIFTGRARKAIIKKNPLQDDEVELAPPPRKRSAVASGYGGPSKPEKSTVCWQFNKGRCTFDVCKFRHMCSICSGRHPAVQCTAIQGQGSASGMAGMPGKRPQVG